MTPRPPSLLPFAFFFALLAFFLSPSYTHRPFGRGRCVGRGSGAGGRIPTNSFVWEKFQIDSRAPNRTPQNGQGSPHRANDQVPPRWAYPIHPNRKSPPSPPMGLPYTSQIQNFDQVKVSSPRSPYPIHPKSKKPPSPETTPPMGLPYTYPTHARTRCTPGTRLTCPARVHPKTEGRQAPRSAYPTLTLYIPAPPMATTPAPPPRAAECIACGHSGGNGNNGKRKKKKNRSKEKKEKKEEEQKNKVKIVYVDLLYNLSFSFLLLFFPPLFPSLHCCCLYALPATRKCPLLTSMANYYFSTNF